MLKLAADENFNNNIYRALIRQEPKLNIKRIQDVGLSGAIDPNVLAWCAKEKRVLLTHDVTTITKYAWERVESGERMSGVIEVGCHIPMSIIIEDILLLSLYCEEDELEGQVLYLPIE